MPSCLAADSSVEVEAAVLNYWSMLLWFCRYTAVVVMVEGIAVEEVEEGEAAVARVPGLLLDGRGGVVGSPIMDSGAGDDIGLNSRDHFAFWI